MKNGQCKVFVLEHAGSIYQGCKVCRQILMTGKFLIGIHIHENGSDFKYVLGAPPQTHCGENKTFMQTFERLADAEKKVAEISVQILNNGSTEGLTLFFVAEAIPN